MAFFDNLTPEQCAYIYKHGLHKPPWHTLRTSEGDVLAMKDVPEQHATILVVISPTNPVALVAILHDPPEEAVCKTTTQKQDSLSELRTRFSAP